MTALIDPGTQVTPGAQVKPGMHVTPDALQAIRLEGVGHGYRGRPVLAGIDLSIRQGERVALIGPNGAGKSTLLRLIAGVLPVATGSLLLRGDPIAGLHRLEIARRLAVVPQEVALPFSARVEEVVALGRLPHEDPFRGPGPPTGPPSTRRSSGSGSAICAAATRASSRSASGSSSWSAWQSPRRPRCSCSTSRPSTSTSATRST